MSKIPELVREYINEEQRDVYTLLFAIVERIDEETRRCVVSLKDDENVMIDDVPVASTFAGSGYGELVPIDPGETEGLLLCAKDPIRDLLSDRGHAEVEKHRQHSFQDAIFFPQVFFDSDTIPSHEPGEYLLAHPSGSLFRILPNGAIQLEHQSGTQIGIDENGVVTIGDPAATQPLAIQTHTHDVTLSDGSTATTDTPNEPGSATEIE